MFIINYNTVCDSGTNFILKGGDTPTVLRMFAFIDFDNVKSVAFENHLFSVQNCEKL